MELKELWRKQKLKGVFVQTVDSPAMPLIAQQAGMDFIFYDCEHGSFAYDKLTNLILLGNAFLSHFLCKRTQSYTHLITAVFS